MRLKLLFLIQRLKEIINEMTENPSNCIIAECNILFRAGVHKSLESASHEDDASEGSALAVWLVDFLKLSYFFFLNIFGRTNTHILIAVVI